MFIPSEQCEAGSYRDSTLTDCTRCEQNYISEQDGAGECSPCSPGAVSNQQNNQCGKERNISLRGAQNIKYIV